MVKFMAGINAKYSLTSLCFRVMNVLSKKLKEYSHDNRESEFSGWDQDHGQIQEADLQGRGDSNRGRTSVQAGGRRGVQVAILSRNSGDRWPHQRLELLECGNGEFGDRGTTAEGEEGERGHSQDSESKGNSGRPNKIFLQCLLRLFLRSAGRDAFGLPQG